jgi:AraC family transcriptional regulator, exoenzyme S synthesis regulatory protein ExsA
MGRLDCITEEQWRERALAARGSVAELARECHVSTRQLERYFRKKRGVRPIRWLNELRLLRALELIGEGLSVKEAGAMLGYQDLSHFTKAFKSFHGKLPSDTKYFSSEKRKCRIFPSNVAY